MKKIISFALLYFLLIIPALQAQAPQLLNYQGKLINKDGTTASGTYVMFFSIYSDTAGMTSLWSETHRQVLVNNGVFNILLGSVVPFPTDLFTGAGNRLLGIQVGSEPEMRPLFRLTSVPYSIKASHSDTAQVAIRVTSGNTLDQAYDQGGPGAGRTITADAGAVTIDGSGGLSVAGGCNLVWIEMRNSAGPAIDFTNEGTTDYDVRLMLTGDDALTIDGGRLGIGTYTPSSQAALDVNGGIKTSWSASDVITPLKPDDWNTITHNRNALSYTIIAVNGDYSANPFSIVGVEFIDSNQFRFYAVGGHAGLARINWIIFAP